MISFTILKQKRELHELTHMPYEKRSEMRAYFTMIFRGGHQIELWVFVLSENIVSIREW